MLKREFFLKPQIVSQVFTTESIQMNQAFFNVPLNSLLTLRYIPWEWSNGMQIMTSKLIMTSYIIEYRKVTFYTSLWNQWDSLNIAGYSLNCCLRSRLRYNILYTKLLYLIWAISRNPLTVPILHSIRHYVNGKKVKEIKYGIF